MKKGISEIVGSGETAEGLPCAVYKALRPLVCGACGKDIVEGALFTRWPLPSGDINILPRCRECVAFRIETPRAKRRSPLLENLLRNEKSAPSAPSVADREKIVEALKQRLGPALRRSKDSGAK